MNSNLQFGLNEKSVDISRNKKSIRIRTISDTLQDKVLHFPSKTEAIQFFEGFIWMSQRVFDWAGCSIKFCDFDSSLSFNEVEADSKHADSEPATVIAVARIKNKIYYNANSNNYSDSNSPYLNGRKLFLSNKGCKAFMQGILDFCKFCYEEEA